MLCPEHNKDITQQQREKGVGGEVKDGRGGCSLIEMEELCQILHCGAGCPQASPQILEDCLQKPQWVACQQAGCAGFDEHPVKKKLCLMCMYCWYWCY